MTRLIIKGGTVVDPVTGKLFQADVTVVGDRIAHIGKAPPDKDATVVDARGCLVLPGLIDMHVHLREPGYEHKETIASGAAAALRGGFAAVCAMPNTRPVCDSAAVVGFVLERGKAAGRARVYPIGALTRGSEGKELAPLGEMRAAGAVAFSDDGRWVKNGHLMRRAMEYAAMLGAPVISHCEDPDLSAGGVMHEGVTASMLGLRGIPAAAEEVAVARDIILAALTGCHLHIAHVSTAGAVRLIREAKARGVKVTAEVTPHHFTLTEEAVKGYNTNAKVNPPLRTPADVAALKEGLADGTIDVIATDHAPHAREEKEVEFDAAPFGMVGLETAVGLTMALVREGVLTLPQLAAKLTTNPARILGFEGGLLREGAPADITLIDPELEETVEPECFASKSGNTPFAGWRLKGLPVGVVVGGRWFAVRPRAATSRRTREKK
ncbi:dihydroorotase [Thermodesulfitimonas autotrophica]|uniref:dihydroorotase n=1 Tax=Thermodesulfitimonas autotrophica TaxID=1894989 RepID=UPI003FCE4F3F